MKAFFSKIFRKIFRKNKWHIEPKYKLFYINDNGDKLSLSKLPAKVIDISVNRLEYKDIAFLNKIILKPDDIINVSVRNYEITENMSILEKAGAISRIYIRYNSNGEFEEIPESEALVL